MNPLSDLVKTLLAGGTTADWLWCIDEGALARHLATRSPEMVTRLLAPQSATDLVKAAGEAGDDGGQVLAKQLDVQHGRGSRVRGKP